MGAKKGYVMSQETKDKISEKRKGKTPALGHKKSAESIEKIREGNLGQKRSDITKARISAAQKKRYNNGI
jgi:hypothetical protein